MQTAHFAGNVAQRRLRQSAWVGVATHGLDLLRLLVGLAFPAGSVGLMMIAGPLYLVWCPLLARDFFRLARAEKR